MNEELERIKAETAKLNAERERIELEHQSLKKEIEKPWYKKERFIQAMVGGLVGLPILWFFLNEIIKPIYLTENIQLKYENMISQIDLKKQKDSTLELKRNLIIKDSLSHIQLISAWDDLSAKELEYKKADSLTKLEYQSLLEAIRKEQVKKDKELAELKEKLGLITASGGSEEIEEAQKIVDNLTEQQSKSRENVDKLSLEIGKEKFNYVDAKMKIEDFILVGDGVKYTETPKNNRPFKAGYPDMIIFHYTASTKEAAVKLLSSDDAKASVHVIIGRNGEVDQLVPFDIVAWHVGKSQYDGRTSLNNFSIGIEFENDGMLEVGKDGSVRTWSGRKVDPKNVVKLKHQHSTGENYWDKYTDAQIQRAEEVCKLLLEEFNIKYIVGNDDVAPGRKQDPGPAFPMKGFQEKFLNQ